MHGTVLHYAVLKNLPPEVYAHLREANLALDSSANAQHIAQYQSLILNEESRVVSTLPLAK